MSETWIVGINPVEAALRNDAERVCGLHVEQGSRNPRLKALLEDARKQNIRGRWCRRAELDRLASGARHQGVAARYAAAQALTENDLAEVLEKAARNALLLVLDGVTDPHNLGACLRSAAAAGASAVIVPKDRAVGVTPVVRKASAGAVDRVPLLVVTNLARTLRELKDAGVWLSGLAADAGQSIHALDFTGPVALVLGGEAEGMRRLTRESCDFVARIPMPGEMESLNVSVAAGIVLFEAVRQRGMQ